MKRSRKGFRIMSSAEFAQMTSEFQTELERTREERAGKAPSSLANAEEALRLNIADGKVQS